MGIQITLFDLIHGYQPFQPPHFVPNSIENTLREVFLPTSIAMKEGSVRRGVQLQGWTIDSWLASPDPIKSLAERTLANLRAAVEEGHVEIGISGYAHPILPLLTEDLIWAQIQLDLETVEKHLGTPTWFWPPEAATDQKVLRVLAEKYPNLIVVIPDKSLGRTNFSGPIRIRYPTRSDLCEVSPPATQARLRALRAGDRGLTWLVCNSLLKDLMMNAAYYSQKPTYVPEEIDWSAAQKMIFGGAELQTVLESLGGDTHILARDWENKGSKDGLTSGLRSDPNREKVGSPLIRQLADRRSDLDSDPALQTVERGRQIGKELKGLVELEADFKLPSEADWSTAETIELETIQPGSWEAGAPENDPFLYWQPNREGERWSQLTKEQQEWAQRWQNLVTDFNQTFTEWAERQGGIEAVLASDELKTRVRKVLPALLSCIPWHILAKPEWGPDPNFSKIAWDKIVTPAREILTEEVKRICN